MTTQQEFNVWLDSIVASEKPDKDIIAYWFGIFESTDGYMAYLTGSKVFDDNDPDWACNVDFVPKNRFLKVGQSNAELQTVLEVVKKYLSDYIQTPSYKSSFLEESTAIAYGFDDGDMFRLR